MRSGLNQAYVFKCNPSAPYYKLHFDLVSWLFTTSGFAYFLRKVDVVGAAIHRLIVAK